MANPQPESDQQQPQTDSTTQVVSVTSGEDGQTHQTSREVDTKDGKVTKDETRAS